MKKLFILLITVSTFYACSQVQSQMKPNESPAYVLVIHGGAGTIDRDKMSEDMEKAYRDALTLALETGKQILADGGTSIDAVEATIKVMENDSLFNAGKGAVFTHDEHVELDASFMDGNTLNAGAVSGLTSTKHPISAARAVLEKSEHVMLSGKGADEFSEMSELEQVENSYFHTKRRLDQVKKRKAQAHADLSPQDELDLLKSKYGTVGAVALDQAGNLAAGTSTGGMTNKKFGRIGDSPVIGAGTYANNASCAVSCTGHGEFFIRNVVAHDVSARMLYSEKNLEESANTVVHEVLADQGATGGLIALDKNGNISMPFNTSGMYRGYITSSGEIFVGIYADEK